MTALSPVAAAGASSNQQMHGKTAALKKSMEKLGGVQRAQDTSLYWPEGLKGEDVKKCSREGMLLSKYNQQYHKLFKDIPLEEVVLKVCSCALQRDLLLQGRLYISPNWLCFHASLFGKDIKVVIPVVSVQMIKKHKMARLLPNGLAITTTTSQKYVFVSLLSRDSVYDMLRRVCTHLQPSSKKSLCVREFPEEPECESLEALIPEMKWRKVCPASRSMSLPDSIPCISRASMESTDSFFPSREPLGSGEFSVLVHSTCLQKQGFLSSHFCAKRSSQLRGFLRAVSFFLQIHNGKPRAQVASENRDWEWAGGLSSAPGRCRTLSYCRDLRL
ncbi:GRAM domain-containing protein 2A isoform X1 [Oryx dammah]|uniref:GRAM domain-containing protein 2A isoform X1 n=2 Tax=Oryx dammah TaxID=59534 RepID=UPI001A9C0966|nr:GRAM domain-containing protein 2A isoform X1 [Oryx dammah]